MPKDYPRSDRISQQIKKELADLLQFQIKDPSLKRLTILDVEVSPCLKHAKVFFVASKYDEEVSKGLKRSMPFLRKTTMSVQCPTCWQWLYMSCAEKRRLMRKR